MCDRASIICLMGPTGAGKTPLALKLAEKLPVEIVSVDSVMVYRGMDIGSAKPAPAILHMIPHHLIDMVDPIDPYSAGRFVTDAMRAISAIQAKGKIPLLVGGTMLYFRALLMGLSNLPKADSRIREEILRDAAEKGWVYLHQQLTKIDPEAARRIHENDSQRIARALEVHAITGKPLSHSQGHMVSPVKDMPVIQLAIAPHDRALLHARIAKRFDLMLKEGLIAEVEKLFQCSDLSPQLPSIRSVGYRQVWAYLAGDIAKEEMREQAIAATRQLAKRQLTWLRSWPNLHWFDSEDPRLLEQVMQ